MRLGVLRVAIEGSAGVETILTFGVQWAIALAAIAVLALTRVIRVNFVWLGAAMLIYALNVAALSLKRFVPLPSALGDLHWNWAGKIAAILASIAVVIGLWAVARKPPKESGFTLIQKPGSFVPAVVATALLIALKIGVEIVGADGRSLDVERILYQATMPGLDEELFWRGTLLLALSEGLRGRRWNVAGAQIGLGGAVTVLLFALGHGMAFQGSGWIVDYVGIAVTGTFAFGLLWLRERTGSVLVPIVAHNVINVLGCLM